MDSFFFVDGIAASKTSSNEEMSLVSCAVETHENKMEGNVMQMKQVPPVPGKGNDSIQFASGGLHAILGLKQELKAGDHSQISLHFKNQEAITMVVPVQEMRQANSMSDY